MHGFLRSEEELNPRISAVLVFFHERCHLLWNICFYYLSCKYSHHVLYLDSKRCVRVSDNFASKSVAQRNEDTMVLTCKGEEFGVLKSTMSFVSWITSFRCESYVIRKSGRTVSILVYFLFLPFYFPWQLFARFRQVNPI